MEEGEGWAWESLGRKGLSWSQICHMPGHQDPMVRRLGVLEWNLWPVPMPSPHLEATLWFSKSAGAPTQVVDFGGHDNLASCLSPQLPDYLCLYRASYLDALSPARSLLLPSFPQRRLSRPGSPSGSHLHEYPPVLKMLPVGRALPEPSSSPWACGAQSIPLPCGLTSSTSVPCEPGDNSQELSLCRSGWYLILGLA